MSGMIVFDSEALLRSISSASKFVTKNSYASLLRDAKFQVSSEGVLISSRSASSYCEAWCDCMESDFAFDFSPSSFCLEPSKLITILSSSSGNVSILLKNENKIVVQTKNGKHEITTKEPSDFIFDAGAELGNEIIVSRDDLISACSFASSCSRIIAGKTKSDGECIGFSPTEDGKGIYVISFDGARLSISTITCDLNLDPGLKVEMLRPSDIITACSAFCHGDMVSLSIFSDKNFARLKCGGATVCVSKLSGEFHSAWKKFNQVSDLIKCEATVSIKDLKSCLSLCSIPLGEESCGISISYDSEIPSKISMDSDSTEHGLSSVTLDAERVDGVSASIRVSSIYFSPMISSIPSGGALGTSGTVVLSLAPGDQGFVKVRCGEGVLGMLAGMDDPKS